MKTQTLLCAMALYLAGISCKSDQDKLMVTAQEQAKQQVSISLVPNATELRSTSALPEVEGHHLRYVLEAYTQTEDGSLGHLVKHVAQVTPTFSLDLDRGTRYTLVGWADFVGSGEDGASLGSTADQYYNTTDLRAVSMKTEQWGLNQAARDAFTASVRDFDPSNPELTITLERPLAMLTIKGDNLDPKYRTLRLAYDEVYTQYNAISGNVLENSKVAKVATVALSEGSQVLAFDYVFAKALPEGRDYKLGSAVHAVKIGLYEGSEASGNATVSYDLSATPFARNYKTNLICANPREANTIHFMIDPVWETPEIDGNYQLIFSDEFDGANGARPNPEMWKSHPRYASTWNRFISTREDVAFLEDGKLVLVAKRNDQVTAADPGQMVSGAVTTQGKFSFKYGKVEARIRTNKHVGNFPAFWLMPVNKERLAWPRCGEIDIWEQIDTRNIAFHTVHSHYTFTLKNKNNPLSHFTTNNTDPNEWHVYGLEWTENELIWYLDGREAGRYERLADERVSSEFNEGQGQFPFRKNFYIILNQSVGDGSWARNPDLDFVYRTEVDWVRVYQKP